MGRHCFVKFVILIPCQLILNVIVCLNFCFNLLGGLRNMWRGDVPFPPKVRWHVRIQYMSGLFSL